MVVEALGLGIRTRVKEASGGKTITGEQNKTGSNRSTSKTVGLISYFSTPFFSLVPFLKYISFVPFKPLAY